MTESLGLIDCDTHCYETRDSGTKFLPDEFTSEAIQTITLVDGNEVIVAGDRVAAFFSDRNLHAFDQAHRPGSLKEILRQNYAGTLPDTYALDDMRPEYVDRDARIRSLDAQGVEKCVLYPSTIGWSAENWVRRTDALYANVHAFNRWYDDTWGFHYQDRIFATPILSLRDLDEAVKETDYLLGRGARVIVLPTGPAYGRSPGDPYFDPVWERLNEAGVTIALHIHDYWSNSTIGPHWGQEPYPTPSEMSAWQWQNTYGERPVTEMISSLIYDNLFGRFPRLRLLSSEFGCEWVPHFLRHLDKSRGMGRNGPWIGGTLTDRPSRIFREYVSVVPYPEDDIPWVVDNLGSCEWMVMGSDWPHPEGLAEPREFADLISTLPETSQQMILRENAERMLSVR